MLAIGNPRKKVITLQKPTLLLKQKNLLTL